MVGEVENIVRSIEDEKIQKEDRDKTRDILARIEDLDKVKHLAAPKPSRILVEERMALRELSDPSKPSSPPTVRTTQVKRAVPSLRRLSDVLKNGGGVGGKDDMWLVVFNDVVLRCQRTGTTSLPLGSAHASRANSPPEHQGKSKYATSGRRIPIARPRNLYKFIQVVSRPFSRSGSNFDGAHFRSKTATVSSLVKVWCPWKSGWFRSVVLRSTN
jgi:hypothetical protein